MQSLNTVWWKMKRRRKIVLFGIVLAMFFYFAISHKLAEFRNRMNFLKVSPCSDEVSREIVAKVCSQYKNGTILGDLCEPLCRQDVVKFAGCLSDKHSKYVVRVECTDFCKPFETITAVLKMARSESLELQDFMTKIDKELFAKLYMEYEVEKINLNDYIIHQDNLSRAIQELLYTNYGFLPRKDQDFLKLLWNGAYSDYFKDMKTSLLFARSFWSVLHQNEYKISKVFSDWGVFPNIYGSCGPMYLSENAPTLFSLTDLSYEGWKNRAKMAVAILHFVQRLDTMEHPLHLCDLKSPHFGITPSNRIKFIDADSVYANEALMHILGGLNCTQHEDCAHFDCEGWCQKDTRKCTRIRSNNNFQMVCAKIFRESSWSGNSGLLSSAPPELEEVVTKLVNSCADDVTQVTQDKIELKKPDLGLLAALFQQLSDSLKDV